MPIAKSIKSSEVAMPADLQTALDAAPAALAAFRAFAPSHCREYINWINEAKTQPTRERRIAQCVERVGKASSAERRKQSERGSGLTAD